MEGQNPVPEYMRIGLPEAVQQEVGRLTNDAGEIDLENATPEQVAALEGEAGPGRVTTPVEMFRPDQDREVDDHDFLARTNNFTLHFSQGLAGPIYQNQTPYRRFALLFPELTGHLTTAQSDFETRTRWEDVQRSPESLAAFRLAYGLMAQLVDAGDSEVRGKSPKDQAWILCQ